MADSIRILLTRPSYPVDGVANIIAVDFLRGLNVDARPALMAE